MHLLVFKLFAKNFYKVFFFVSYYDKEYKIDSLVYNHKVDLT